MSLRVYLYDTDGTDRDIELTEELVGGLTERQLLWIDLYEYENQELQQVASLLGLQHEAVSNLLQKLRRPRMDNYSNYFHINVSAIIDEQPAYRVSELDFIVGANFVLTAHREPVPFLQKFVDQVKGDSQLGQLDAPALLSALMDWHITDYFRAIEGFEVEVDRMEELALRFRSEQNMLGRLVLLRRRASQIRRALAPHREVFAALARPDFQKLSGSRSSALFRALNDRLERALETVDNARELIIGAFEIFSTQTTQRTNHTIKLLTLFSVVLMPASVIAGLMGMNFHARIYETGDRGFWAVIFGIVLIAGTTLYLARHNRWI